MYCPLNITQHITIIVQITGKKNLHTQVNMSKLCSKCQYFVGAPLLSNTTLILLGMEFTRASQAVAGILFHSSIIGSWPGCLQQTVFLWASFRRGFLLGRRSCKPTCCSVWRMVWALTSWPYPSATSKPMLAALMRLFFEASFCTWCTAQGLYFFDRPLRGQLQVNPVLENLCMTLATVL